MMHICHVSYEMCHSGKLPSCPITISVTEAQLPVLDVILELLYLSEQCLICTRMAAYTHVTHAAGNLFSGAFVHGGGLLYTAC